MAHLVTGYAGYEHIQSKDQGALIALILGKDQYVANAGNELGASIIDNNTVRILDGDLVMQGRLIRIEPKTHEDVTIRTGTAGKNRVDLICMTYEKNANDGTEKAYLQVVQGEESESTAQLPQHTSGNILDEESFNQMPLYKVTISGVILESVEPVFETCKGYLEMIAAIISGTQKVGDSKKLDGHDVSYFAKASDIGGDSSDSTSNPIEFITVPSGSDIKAIAENTDICPMGSTTYLRMYLPTNAPLNNGDFYVTVQKIPGLNTWIRVTAENVATSDTYIMIMANGTWRSWIRGTIDTDLANYLLAKGGRLTSISDYIGGRITFQKPTLGQTLNGELVQDLAYTDRLRFYESNGDNRGAYIDLTKCGASMSSEILHTGNKPSGSYTGNGSSEERTITTGGIGEMLLLYEEGSDVFTLITSEGATIKIDSTVSGIPSGEMWFQDGILHIKMSSIHINASGKTYKYQVI